MSVSTMDVESCSEDEPIGLAIMLPRTAMEVEAYPKGLPTGLTMMLPQATTGYAILPTPRIESELEASRKDLMLSLNPTPCRNIGLCKQTELQRRQSESLSNLVSFRSFEEPQQVDSNNGGSPQQRKTQDSKPQACTICLDYIAQQDSLDSGEWHPDNSLRPSRLPTAWMYGANHSNASGGAASSMLDSRSAGAQQPTIKKRPKKDRRGTPRMVKVDKKVQSERQAGASQSENYSIRTRSRARAQE